VSELRTARQVVTEFQMQAPRQLRGPLGAFVKWLDEQERKATQFGRELAKQREGGL
jgi:hypothetical protein